MAWGKTAEMYDSSQEIGKLKQNRALNLCPTDPDCTSDRDHGGSHYVGHEYHQQPTWASVSEPHTSRSLACGAIWSVLRIGLSICLPYHKSEYNVRNIAFISGLTTATTKTQIDDRDLPYPCTSPMATAKTNTTGGPTYSLTSEL